MAPPQINKKKCSPLQKRKQPGSPAEQAASCPRFMSQVENKAEVLAGGLTPRGSTGDIGSAVPKATCSETNGQVQGKPLLRARGSGAAEPQVPIFHFPLQPPPPSSQVPGGNQCGGEAKLPRGQGRGNVCLGAVFLPEVFLRGGEGGRGVRGEGGMERKRNRLILQFYTRGIPNDTPTDRQTGRPREGQTGHT